jgi:hypothetical protein
VASNTTNGEKSNALTIGQAGAGIDHPTTSLKMSLNKETNRDTA